MVASVRYWKPDAVARRSLGLARLHAHTTVVSKPVKQVCRHMDASEVGEEGKYHSATGPLDHLFTRISWAD